MSYAPALLTLNLIVVSVLLASGLGIPAGAALATLDRGLRRSHRVVQRCFVAAMVSSLALPLVLHAAAWEATAGKFGWLPLSQITGRQFGWFSGLLASGWIHGLHGVPLVALATWQGLRRVPPSLVDQFAVESQGRSSFWGLQLPLAAPWILLGCLGVALLAATEMTVVNLYAYATLADQFYVLFASTPDAVSISLLCLPPGVIAAVGCAILLRSRLLNRKSMESISVTPPESNSQRIGMSPALALAAITIVVVAVPLLGLVIKAGHQVQRTDSGISGTWSPLAFASAIAEVPTLFRSEFQWSGAVAMTVGLTAIAIAWPLARINHTRPRLAAATTIALIIGFMIPGPVVGLMIVRVFQLPIAGLQDHYERTLVPTILALLFRALPIAYWIMRIGYLRMTNELSQQSRIDGSWWNRITRIDARAFRREASIAAVAAGLIAAGDVPATLPVAPPEVVTVSTRLFSLLHSGARYQEAALALVYSSGVAVIVNTFMTARLRTKKGQPQG
ncbi:MAG: hypothetical protein AAGA03_13915 [Planctomycetota bacterium]